MFSIDRFGNRQYNVPIDLWPRKREVIGYNNTVQFDEPEEVYNDPYKKPEYAKIKNPTMHTLPHRGKLVDEPIQAVFDEPERDFKDISTEFVRFTGDRKLSEIVAELRLIKPTAEPKKALELMLGLIQAKQETLTDRDVKTVQTKAKELPIKSYIEEFGKRIVDQTMWRSQYPQILLYLLNKFPSTGDGFISRFVNNEGKTTTPQLQTMMRKMNSRNDVFYLDLETNTVYAGGSIDDIIMDINPLLLPDTLRRSLDSLDEKDEDEVEVEVEVDKDTGLPGHSKNDPFIDLDEDMGKFLDGLSIPRYSTASSQRDNPLFSGF